MEKTAGEATVRQKLIALLTQGDHTIRELSRAVGISEKDVGHHLDHVARSAASHKMKFRMTPPLCLACGHAFEDRKRLAKPGRCPKCKSERIQSPAYRIE